MADGSTSCADSARLWPRRSRATSARERAKTRAFWRGYRCCAGPPGLSPCEEENECPTPLPPLDAATEAPGAGFACGAALAFAQLWDLEVTIGVTVDVPVVEQSEVPEVVRDMPVPAQIDVPQITVAEDAAQSSDMSGFLDVARFCDGDRAKAALALEDRRAMTRSMIRWRRRMRRVRWLRRRRCKGEHASSLFVRFPRNIRYTSHGPYEHCDPAVTELYLMMLLTPADWRRVRVLAMRFFDYASRAQYITGEVFAELQH